MQGTLIGIGSKELGTTVYEVPERRYVTCLAQGQ